MLTLFILKSGSLDADPQRTLRSFVNKKVAVTQVCNLATISGINEIEKENDWFFVIYDNEIIGESLITVLDVYLKQSKRDVLVLYKKSPTITKSPRVFRKHVKLMPDTLIPSDKTIKFDTVLDGWIK